MTAQYSPRHALPFLTTGQAQKEITHNEALILIDSLLHPVVQGVESVAPIVAQEDAGRCWLVAEYATGDWAGHGNELACWTGGSWRFLKMPLGSHIFDGSNDSECHFSPSGWTFAPQISSPTGGAIIDSEAREVIELLLEHLRATGVVVSGA